MLYLGPHSEGKETGRERRERESAWGSTFTGVESGVLKTHSILV